MDVNHEPAEKSNDASEIKQKDGGSSSEPEINSKPLENRMADPLAHVTDGWDATGEESVNNGASSEKGSLEQQLTKQLAELLGRVKDLERKSSKRDAGSRAPSRRRASTSSTVPGTPVPDRQGRVRSKPEMNCMTVEEFKKRTFAFDKPHCTLDIVMSSNAKTTSAGLKRADSTLKPSMKEESTPTPSPTHTLTASQSHESYEPVRFIQINSQALATILEDNTEDALVIYSPFKSLSYREQKMRDQLVELEKKWGHKTWKEVDAAMEADEAQHSAETENMTTDSVMSFASKKPETYVDERLQDTTKDVASRSDSISKTDLLAAAEGDGHAQVGERKLSDEPESTASDKNVRAAGGSIEADLVKGDTSEGITEAPPRLEVDGKPEPDVSEEKTTLLTNDDKTDEGMKAYEDLKCLMAFYDEYVKSRWDYFRSDRVKTVRFGDLCSIFQPGDEIVMTGSPQKVWRVLKITGGRPTLDHLYVGDFTNTDDNKHSTDADEVVDREKLAQDSNEVETTKGKSGGRATDRGLWSLFHIDGYYIDFDGKEFGAVHMKATIKYFPGRRDVKSLQPYPLRLDGGKMRQRYLENGKRFLQLTQMGLRYYDGRTLTKSPRGDSLEAESKAWTEAGTQITVHRQTRPEDISSQVVIDFERAFQYNQDWVPKFGIEEFEEYDRREWDLNRIPDKDPLTDTYRQYLDYFDVEQTKIYRAKDDWVQVSGEKSTDDRERFVEVDYLILPDRVYGFVLRSRTWACFDIRPDYLQPVAQDSGYEELQLPLGHKRTLESLVERHFRNKEAAVRQGQKSMDFDFVQGKGKGLIVLLHGSPGVGKTSTAETIASKYARPLLPITCGNLGLDAHNVEQSLTENFSLAQAWECIVLLDEADVFLAQRGKSDLQRNALVSVFLRTLEYYTGVLFLTTNRTGAFDEAFRSRIHTALYYPDLGRPETEAIWRTNLRRLIRHKEINKQNLIVENEGDEIIRYAMVHYDWHRRSGRMVWNGRQIRNSFQTAVALAEFDSKEKGIEPTLHWTHFRTVAQASDQFENYLRDTRSYTDAELAEWDSVRANYGPGNMNPSNDASSGQQSLQRISTKESLQAISDLRPDTILVSQPSFVGENPFSDHTPQKKMSLNQRIAASGPLRVPYSNPQQYDDVTLRQQGPFTNQPQFSHAPSNIPQQQMYNDAPHLQTMHMHDSGVSSQRQYDQPPYQPQQQQQPRQGMYGSGGYDPVRPQQQNQMYNPSSSQTPSQSIGASPPPSHQNAGTSY